MHAKSSELFHSVRWAMYVLQKFKVGATGVKVSGANLLLKVISSRLCISSRGVRCGGSGHSWQGRRVYRADTSVTDGQRAKLSPLWSLFTSAEGQHHENVGESQTLSLDQVFTGHITTQRSAGKIFHQVYRRQQLHPRYRLYCALGTAKSKSYHPGC